MQTLPFSDEHCGLAADALLDKLQQMTKAEQALFLPPYALVVQTENLFQDARKTVSVAEDAQILPVNSHIYVFLLKPRPESQFSFISIGRNPHNDVVLNDSSVSGFHAFLLDENKLEIQDVGSKNGTFVDDKPVLGEAKNNAIASGASLRFGQVNALLLNTTELLEFLERTCHHSPL